MQDYAHTARHGGAYDPDLSIRLDAFGHSIEQALRDGCNEVLVVGHSSGAHLGVSVLARLQRAGIVTPKSPISFLNLGHVVPMVSFLPAATELRSDLKQLGNSDAVTWVDVTAPGDGCSFALCDPVAVSGQRSGGRDAKWAFGPFCGLYPNPVRCPLACAAMAVFSSTFPVSVRL